MPKERRKIKRNKWYIVDLRSKGRIGYKLFKVEFATKKKAKEALKRNLGGKTFLFDVVKGDQAIEFKFTFTKVGFTSLGYILKYDYPEDKITEQQRKSFRTKYRRWKRNYKKELTAGWS